MEKFRWMKREQALSSYSMSRKTGEWDGKEQNFNC